MKKCFGQKRQKRLAVTMANKGKIFGFKTQDKTAEQMTTSF
jgi:hypothetical protein